MRDILQGFTMYVNGDDFGEDTEELTLPVPTPTTQNYRGGGMDLAVEMPMFALEAMEITIKQAGQSVRVQRMCAKGPGSRDSFQFRGAVQSDSDGSIAAHVIVVEGSANADSRDSWNRGEKVGFNWKINNLRYFRYEADGEVIHEVQAWPPKRIVYGVDQLASVNAALGY